MKYLFLFLLLLNILYALWQLQDGRASRALLESADAPLDAGLPRAPHELQPLVSADQVRPSVSPLCIDLGVFKDNDRAEQLRQRLLVLGIQSGVVAREVPGSVDYALVLEVPGGRREALAQLSLLQDRGIDSFLLTQGNLKGSLSLGIFSREDYAQARMAQLQVFGYDVQIEQVEKFDSEYLVRVDSLARRLVDQSLLARLKTDFPDLQHQYHSCPRVGAPSELGGLNNR
ncbi:hypothetical protein LCGC14_1519020 [marine sediment metagenome]|uniref:SPOR domain-containing protein n=1 Tax=marine sediment metagenome TaxID=412755 RepID=A0A0F9LES9_9ZZZZ